jgi:predicted small lipoprotein YifL
MSRRDLIALLAAALLAACGRKGDLEPPPQEDGDKTEEGTS